MMDLSCSLDLAAEWHGDQTRKGRKHEPFVHHPLRVAAALIRCGISGPAVIRAALLHDILEDTECPPEAVRDVAGEQVLKIVLELTDRKEYLKSLRKQMQVERADLLSPEAKKIRLADKTDNLRSMLDDPPENWSWQRKREYVAWANRVVRRLGDVHPAMEQEYRRVSASVWHLATGATGIEITRRIL